MSEGGRGMPWPAGVPAGGAENPIFSGPIFWPIFPGLDPGPAQGLTWASPGLDPGQPRSIFWSRFWSNRTTETTAFTATTKGGAREARARPFVVSVTGVVSVVLCPAVNKNPCPAFTADALVILLLP